MAEALGVAASVIGVLQITGTIIAACVGYFKKAKRAREDISHIMKALSGVEDVLEDLVKVVDEHKQDPYDNYLQNLKSLSSTF